MIKRTTKHLRECRLADHMPSGSEGDIVSLVKQLKKKMPKNNFSQKKGD